MNIGASSSKVAGILWDPWGWGDNVADERIQRVKHCIMKSVRMFVDPRNMHGIGSAGEQGLALHVQNR